MTTAGRSYSQMVNHATLKKPFFSRHHRVDVSGSRLCPSTTNSALSMGLLDSISNFLDSRQGDFVKLEDTNKEFGPGPLLILYNVPSGIEMDEIKDMLEDGAPKAHAQGIKLFCLSETDCNKALDLSLEDALNQISSGTLKETPARESTMAGKGVPVLFFSGFRNEEMMEAYNIIGQEIYQETAGQAAPACAKAVPKAMEKPFRQVLEEISGDHLDAMEMDQ